MSQTVEAIYENGIIRPLQPLDLPDQAYVRVSVEAVADGGADAERAAWLAQSERALTREWDNDPDDIYNELFSQ